MRGEGIKCISKVQAAASTQATTVCFLPCVQALLVAAAGPPEPFHDCQVAFSVWYPLCTQEHLQLDKSPS